MKANRKREISGFLWPFKFGKHRIRRAVLDIGVRLVNMCLSQELEDNDRLEIEGLIQAMLWQRGKTTYFNLGDMFNILMF